MRPNAAYLIAACCCILWSAHWDWSLSHAFILKEWYLRPLLKSNSAITDMSGLSRADSLFHVFAVFVRRKCFVYRLTLASPFEKKNEFWKEYRAHFFIVFLHIVGILVFVSKPCFETSASEDFRSDINQRGCRSFALYCTIRLIWYDIFFNCNWVVTRWQKYSTHLHTNNTQNDTKQTIHRTTQQFWKSAGRAPS